MKNTYAPEEPISAISTPLAPGALGIVRTSGKNSIELISKVFSRPKALKEAKGNTLVYGWIQEKVDENTVNRIDEVMLGVYRNPKSFTGEDMVEIFCHGGTQAVSAIQSLLLKKGFRCANRGEYTFRSFINGKTDLTKAEAVKEIIESKTDASRGRAAGRLAGDVFNVMQEIKKLLINTAAAIEVEIEYPEDEENIRDSFDVTNLLKARDELQKLSDSWRSEKLYQDGAKVILCGRTNAGKSSLFNALLKEERSIVSDIHGTTRDWIDSWVSFDGIPARLFDTAGLRETTDVIEKQGVEITKDLSHEADLILYLVDSTVGITKEDEDFLFEYEKSSKENKASKIPLVLIFNKSDLQNESISGNQSKSVFESEFSTVKLSAKHGDKISDLISVVKNILIKQTATEKLPIGIGSQRQKVSIDEALENVEHALKIARSEFTMDAVVQDIEEALFSLSEITGEVTPDDILETVFSSFCVGK